MISEIHIQNFKSIQDLTLKPGRVTVLIGANGSGKSNILESIAFAAGASADKLDNEFLFNRGIRVTEDTWTQAAFPDEEEHEDTARQIKLSLKGEEGMLSFDYRVTPIKRREDGSFMGWRSSAPVSRHEVDEALLSEQFAEEVEIALQRVKDQNQTTLSTRSSQFDPKGVLKRAIAITRLARTKLRNFSADVGSLGLADFIIYAPENTVLRTPPPEGAILPLGAKGEGLFKLLQSFVDPKIDSALTSRFEDLKSRLHLFGWFEDMLPPDDAATAQARLQLRDRWLAEDRAIFDQRSANEGFLYVLFYFTLMMSWRTPNFFAIDNLDNALNPKLCAVLMQQITELARTYGKQVICTVHNPAILDGLDLAQDDQRLFAVRRNAEGHTVVRRVHAPQPQPGETPVRLSEAFTRGLIGGLPNNF